MTTSDAEQVSACCPRLQTEIALVQPELIVCLGATAAQTLIGRAFRVSLQRGRLLESKPAMIAATEHPSSILRAPDDASRLARDAAICSRSKIDRSRAARPRAVRIGRFLTREPRRG
ncbi:MAG TPA: uracil-DNA glycosylase family protein [Candidatus Binataceae bacterium]|nr:uracil-DNA glycosylase family protein [Candidatus Binataceae bacterium]